MWILVYIFIALIALILILCIAKGINIKKLNFKMFSPRWYETKALAQQ